MSRGGENMIYCFLAGTLVAALLHRFLKVTIEPLLLLVVPVISFCMTLCLYFRISLVTERGVRVAAALLVALFFLGCGALNYSCARGGRGADLREGKIAACMEKIKEGVIGRTEGMITSKRESSVAIALTVGDRVRIPGELKRAYSESGILHALALSGMHISIIYNLISGLLLIFNISYRGRRIKLFASLTLIFLYSMMTGFSASIQRSAIMIFLYKTVELSGRFRGKWSALAFAAAVIILIDPEMMASVSFQLSFSAVAGIIAIYPTMQRSFERLFGRWQGYRFLAPLINLLCLSTACQIATSPFTWFYFRKSPELFLIANIAAIPLVTAAIYLYPIALIFTCFNPLPNYPAAILEFLLRQLNNAILYIGN